MSDKENKPPKYKALESCNWDPSRSILRSEVDTDKEKSVYIGLVNQNYSANHPLLPKPNGARQLKRSEDNSNLLRYVQSEQKTS